MSTAFTLALLWRPFFAPLPISTAVAIVVALAVFSFARSRRGHAVLGLGMLLMRLLLLGAITALLMGPSVVPPAAQRQVHPKLLIMVDTSGSMLTPDMAGTTRFDFATSRWLNPRQIERLTEKYDLSLLGFDEGSRPITAGLLKSPAAKVATGKVSNIAASVHDVLAGTMESAQGATMLVISDGRDTTDKSLQAASVLARQRSIPVHTVAMGGPNLQRDLAVVALPLQEYLLAGEEGQIAVRAIQTNAGESTSTLHLRCGDEHVKRTIAFEGRDSVTLNLPIKQARPGFYEYRLALEAVSGEVETRNNEQTVFMEVTSDRMRVLLLEGQPFWDTKFLAQSLRKDERIELTQITQVSPRRTEKILSRADSPSAEVPESIDQWKAYDVIILGRSLEHLLEVHAAASLRDYVSTYGGRIVFARGRAYSPNTSAGRRIGREIDVLEPVVWGRGRLHNQKVVLAPAGRFHPSFVGGHDGFVTDEWVNALPALRVVPVVEREKASAKVLARARPAGAAGGGAARGQPAIVTMQYYRGMIVAILGEGLWRWSLLARKSQQLEGIFDRFWSNMIRWLIVGGEFQPGQQLTVRLSRPSVQVGEPLTFDVFSRSFDVAKLDAHVQIVGPEGERHEPALQAVGGSAVRRSATFTPRSVGTHEIVVDVPELAKPVRARFSAYDVDLERLRSTVNAEPLRLLAEHSGGQFLNPYTPEALFDVLQRHRASMVVPPRPQYVWDKAWLMALLLSWAGIEWLIRKTGGLL